MNSVFNEQVLSERLSKLNNTQQCIETLSHWCIFHRKHAEQIIQTWDKQFHSSKGENRIPFLYLANDILQNSKRNGNEFVAEFWKVLPAALKDVLDNGDDHGKTVVSRLVNIWEERRVFGSRAQGLKDLMLGSEPPPALELNKKRSRTSIKIMKRDSRSLRIKLSVGGTAEKIMSALHNVLTEHSSEELNLNNCRAAVRRVGKLEKDVDKACNHDGDPRRESLTSELKVEEDTLNQCIEKLKLLEENRAALMSVLKEALQEQESEVEDIRTHLQLAYAMVEEAANMRRRLNNEPVLPIKSSSAEPPNLKSNGPSAEVRKKSAAAIAAEVADKLAASTHSQQIMTSVLSTFAAQEAKNVGLAPSTSSSATFPEGQEKRMKVENPLVVSDATGNPLLPVQPVIDSTPHQQQTVLMQPSQMQNQASSQIQYMYPAPSQQFPQPPGSVMIGLPYAYRALPPQPPPPPSQIINLMRPTPLTHHQQQAITLMQQTPPSPATMTLNQPMAINQQPPQFAIQQPAAPSFRPLQQPGMPFYHPQTH